MFIVTLGSIKTADSAGVEFFEEKPSRKKRDNPSWGEGWVKGKM